MAAALSHAMSAAAPGSKRTCKRSKLILFEHRLPRDGFVWLKYGQKELSGGTLTRHYFRCAQRVDGGEQCAARRVVDFNKVRPDSDLAISYSGKHTHEPPPPAATGLVNHAASTSGSDVPNEPVVGAEATSDLLVSGGKRKRTSSSSSSSSSSLSEDHGEQDQSYGAAAAAAAAASAVSSVPVAPVSPDHTQQSMKTEGGTMIGHAAQAAEECMLIGHAAQATTAQCSVVSTAPPCLLAAMSAYPPLSMSAPALRSSAVLPRYAPALHSSPLPFPPVHAVSPSCEAAQGKWSSSDGCVLLGDDHQHATLEPSHGGAPPQPCRVQEQTDAPAAETNQFERLSGSEVDTNACAPADRTLLLNRPNTLDGVWKGAAALEPAASSAPSVEAACSRLRRADAVQLQDLTYDVTYGSLNPSRDLPAMASSDPQALPDDHIASLFAEPPLPAAPQLPAAPAFEPVAVPDWLRRINRRRSSLKQMLEDEEEPRRLLISENSFGCLVVQPAGQSRTNISTAHKETIDPMRPNTSSTDSAGSIRPIFAATASPAEEQGQRQEVHCQDIVVPEGIHSLPPLDPEVLFSLLQNLPPLDIML